MPITHDELAFLNNGGTLGARTAAYDWANHPLGPTAGWLPSLRTALGIVLGSSFPMFLAWTEELYLFFNDAYQPILGTKVGDALGRPLPQVWPEVWDTIGPIVRGALASESFFFESFPVTLERHGYPEQTWFTFSYSPVRDEAGKVLGLICMVVEDTEKVRALARHKQAEERLALSLEASGNIGTWSVDLETGATFVDERFARLFQVDAPLASAGTELERFTSMIHHDDRARVLAAIDTAIRQETLYDIEYRIPQLSGHDAWVNARGKVFADPVTGRRRFAGVAVDISGRKEAERARIESERIAVAASGRAEENSRRLDVLLDAAPVGIVYVDTTGRLLVANASNRAIWGEHPPTGGIDDYAAWQGWWPQGALGAGQRLGAEEWPMARVLRGEESTAGAIVEIEPFGQPGVRKTILIRAAAIRNEHGAVIGAVGANMDISAQVTAERALQESERKFRTIANVIPQMVWSANADGVNDYLNSRWHAFTGVPIEQLAGDGWRPFIHPDDLAVIDAAWLRCLADGSAFEVEHRLAHHDGQQRWVLNRALPVRDDDGRITRWMGTLTDVHDQKVSEEELKAAARRKDEFLAMLAHELRNPLAPISNAAQLLSLAPTDPARVRQSSAVITRQVRHMTDLVDDLLDVSRVTRGLVELDRQPVDIKTVVTNAVEQARPLIEARRHALDLHMDSAPGWVVGDRTRLVQIVANILNNAAKYTPQGGHIGLTVGVDEGQVRIAIADSGIGISPELLPHVFELFTQAERTPDRSQGGLGLGLALVHSLVQLHHGHVKASSKGRDQGSVFTVTLPLAPGLRQPDAPESHTIDGAPQPGVGRSVLVVDDNVDAAQSLADVLRSLGHVARIAATPTEALDTAASEWPQVFILDIGLPEIDGYQLARRLRALPGARPALYLALTGYGQAHDRVLSKSAGFDHHFVKPVDLPALAALLAQA